jgi:hypothetical protein
MIKLIVQSFIFVNLAFLAISFEADYDKNKGTISITGLDSREFLSLTNCFAKLKAKRPLKNRVTNNKVKNRQPIVRPFLIQPENLITSNPTEVNDLENMKLENVQALTNEQETLNEALAQAEKITETNDAPIDSQQQETKRSQDRRELSQALLDFLGLDDVDSFKREMLRDKGSMIYVGKKDMS